MCYWDKTDRENYNEIFFKVTEKQAVTRELYEKQFANI